ncbi:MAG: bifunctional precorrin-2 dehydrogenase/sirohydrochlorin ferrochelatase [Acidimicrobiales bacterium]
MTGNLQPAATTPRSAIEIVPVGLRVEGKAVLVVGAGRIAARKADAYASQGAIVTVVAPQHSPEMDAVDAAERHHRAFRASDLDGQWLVVTATGRPEVDGEVYAEAETCRIWCNAADDPEHCSVILPAVVRRDGITIAISSGGRSPATASWLRRRIERLLDHDTLAVFAIAAGVRDRMRANGQPTEVAGWNEVLDNDALPLVAAGEHDELARRLATAVGVPT